MRALLIDEMTFYCPKCNKTYEDGIQRFCLDDGSRLLPAPSSIKAAAKSKGIFTKILRNQSDDVSGKNNASAPRMFIEEPDKDERNTFHTNFSSKVFKEDKKLSINEKKINPQNPVMRLVKPSEVPSGTADIGDRKSNPTGRESLSWDNPKALMGQTIKGRYLITDILRQDDSSITYLAEDKINTEKEMIVRVLMNEETDDFLNRILTEERVSLSHVNHPYIVNVLDSGELLEGNPFIVMDMVDGFSVKEKLEILEKFEPARAAKIIRQVSYALSELHQNGILHRNLKPENIFLVTTEAVKEQVKLTDFAVSVKINRRNIESVKYCAPEQLEGSLPNYASDIYSLAVIAFEMLTGQHPFQFSTADKLLKAQKKGLPQNISEEPFGLSSETNEILTKALSYEPSDRYAKARDFGDALFQTLTSDQTEETEAETSSRTEKQSLPISKNSQVSLDFGQETKDNDFLTEKTNSFAAPILIKSQSEIFPLENSSPDKVNKGNNKWLWLIGLGIIALLITGWLIWNSTQITTGVSSQNLNSSVQNTALTAVNNSQNSLPVQKVNLASIENRNMEFFQNSNLNLPEELAKNYNAFSLYYPKDWQKNENQTNFIDISKKAESGTPIEQFLVSYYESQGTFELDKESFPKLVQESSKTLSNIITNYRLISEDETTVNNSLKSYEMKFEGAGVTRNDEKIQIWGKRIFIPVNRQEAKSGFVITMIATSLSTEVKGADDIGTHGELAKILSTFLPSAVE